jgi:hypothetical protein
MYSKMCVLGQSCLILFQKCFFISYFKIFIRLTCMKCITKHELKCNRNIFNSNLDYNKTEFRDHGGVGWWSFLRNTLF